MPYLAILSLSLSFFIPTFPLSLPSYPLSSSLSGITLVDETSPVDEPSDSDQVTEGVKFAYTLPHQQSNQEDSQDDTALVCVHPCVFVSVCVCIFWVCTAENMVCVYIVYAHAEEGGCDHVIATLQDQQVQIQGKKTALWAK